ncbi:MAG TPA: NADH-quinone oxidoreductase subunit M [Actinomycetota bacterium]|nr:NADH-quinone oxidoreductase subunit M [Actinomycetota bacterium]
MEWFDAGWGLSLATFLPVVGALVLLFVPAGQEQTIKLVGTVFAGLSLIAAIGVALRFDYGQTDQIQLGANLEWIAQIGARYHIGVDGLSLPMFVLSALVTFLCCIYMWFHIPDPGKPKAFFALVLLLATGMNGAFVALDLILFFIFFEIVLVPMYFMIGIWGGPRREYAAVKFFLYTLFGSIFMLLGFLALWVNSGGLDGGTFDMIALRDQGVHASELFQNLVFLGLFLGFAIKVPMWPFHTWLPDAHTEAPTVGSVLLAAILLKMGTYGFIRIALPILPDAAVTYAPIIGILAVIAIIYGALCCLAQTDLKRLIAFSSVGHMGFVMLGIATLTDAGINGAIFAMVAHGLITGMLFFLAGSIHERYHTREIAELGGLLKQIPRFGTVFTYAAIASLGLPGLAGFWGEMLALLGSYNPAPDLDPVLFRVLMVGGGVGTVLTAGYLLWTIQRVNLGRVPERFADGHGIHDVVPLEWIAWAPLLVLILAAGVFPKLMLGVTDGAVQHLVQVFGAVAGH